jgi:hypothetical protein
MNVTMEIMSIRTDVAHSAKLKEASDVIFQGIAQKYVEMDST